MKCVEVIFEMKEEKASKLAAFEGLLCESGEDLTIFVIFKEKRHPGRGCEIQNWHYISNILHDSY